MKKTMLWSALFTLINTQIHADTTPLAQPAAPQENTTSSATQQPVVQAPNQGSSTTPSTQPAAPQPTPSVPSIEPITAAPMHPAVPVIDCTYKVPADMKTIDDSLLRTWSEHAAMQAFDFTPTTIDAQLNQLKSCFTEQGWTGFNTALEKSGNIEAIKSQNLTVSSQIDGQTQMTAANTHQWKLNIPMHVVYQNDKEKVTQLLDVAITVERDTTGNLGISQMVATPRKPAGTPQVNNGATSNTPLTETTPETTPESTPATATPPTAAPTAPAGTSSGEQAPVSPPPAEPVPQAH